MRKRPAGLVIRSTIAFFLIAAHAVVAAKSATPTPAAPAPNLEIPESVLAQESPSRAAFNAAEQARAKELEELLSSDLSIVEVNGRVRGETAGVGFVVLLAYVRILQKDARDDQRFASLASEQTVAMTNKKKKLEEEKAKIDALKRAAAERFDRAMSAASIESALGLVACAEAAAAYLKAPRKPEPTATATPTPARTPTRTPVPKKAPRKAK